MNYFRIIFLLPLFWIFSNEKAAASHMAGADMSYIYLGGDSFEVTVKVYRDCHGVDVAMRIVDITSLDCSISVFYDTLKRISVTDITPVCNGVQSFCSGGVYPYGIQELVFKGVINLSAYNSCCKFRVSFLDGTRNSIITTLQSGLSLYAEIILDKCLTGRNSSPQLTNIPIAMICAGQDYCFNNGVTDIIDGDSLSFALAEPLFDLGSPVPYKFNFNKDRPMTFLGFPNQNLPLPSGFHLDGLSGDLCFRPVWGEVGVIVIKITEWRRINGIPTNIGETRRDMQLIVATGGGCNTNKTPTLPVIPVKNICAGKKLTFNITPNDLNPGDSLSVKWNNGIPAATFTTTNDAAKIGVGTFSWTPAEKDTSPNLYYFTVTVTDNSCPLRAVTSRSYSIRVNATPKIKMFTANECYPAANNFSDSSTVPFGYPAFRKWSFGDGDTSDQISPLHVYPGLGSFDVKLKVTSDKGCIDSAVKTVNYYPKPVAGFNTSIDCQNFEATFTNTSVITPDSIVTNTWTFGDGTGSTILSPVKTYSAAGIYLVKLIVVSDNNCSDTIENTVSMQLELDSLHDTILCRGQYVEITASGKGGDTSRHTFLWDHGIGPGKTVQLNPDTTTIYRVIFTDSCNSFPDTGYVIVTVRPQLEVKATNDTMICIGQAVNLSASSGGGYAPGHSLNWDQGLGTGNNFIVAPDTTTTYSVILSDGCSSADDTAYVNVIVRAPLEVNAGADQLICFGESATLVATATGGDSTGYIYTWSHGIGNGAVKQVSPFSPETYSIILTDNCTTKPDTALITVNVRPPLIVQARPPVKICSGESVQLYSTGSGGDSIGYIYSWDNGLGIGNNLTVSPTHSTTYTVTLQDGCSIIAADTVTIQVEQQPEVDFKAEPQIACAKASVQFLNLSTFQASSSFSWNFGDSGTSSLMAPVYSFSSPGIYDISLKISSPFGCSDSIIKTGFITVNPNPTAGFSATPNPANILSPVIYFENFSMGANDYLWDFDDNSANSTSMHTSHEYADTGNYLVMLVAKNIFGCVDMLQKKIRINDVFRFFIPTSFTPNNDLLNDEFKPSGLGIKNYRTRIYNRWGQLVFESTDRTLNWNGAFYNKLPAIEDGVYLYQFSVEDFQGNDHFFNGVVTLLR